MGNENCVTGKNMLEIFFQLFRFYFLRLLFGQTKIDFIEDLILVQDERWRRG